MTHFIAILTVALALLLPSQTFAGPAEDGSATIDRWVAAYSSNDVDTLLKVYAPDAILHGTSEPQHRRAAPIFPGPPR